MIYIQSDLKSFEDKLKVFTSGLGNIFEELISKVGEKMVEEAASNAPVNTGKLKRNIKFLIPRGNDIVFAFTTKKNLGNSNVWYSNIREHGANIQAKKAEYLTFKVNGEWKKVKSVRTRAQPYMKPVWNSYFGNDSSRGYQELANALSDKMKEEIG